MFYPDEDVAFMGINTWRGVTKHEPIFDGRTYVRIGPIKQAKMVIYPIMDNIDGQGRQLIMNRVNPPDFIIDKVEALTGDKPFKNLDDFITQDELRAFSESYQRVAGFRLEDVR